MVRQPWLIQKIVWLSQQWWLRLAVGLGLVVLLASRFEFSQVSVYLQQVPLWVLGIAFLIFVLMQIVYAWRWQYLLAAQGISVSLRQTLALNYLSLFTSNFLPGSMGGDVLKWAVLSADTLPREKVFASIVVDRFINLGTNAMLLLILFFQGQKLFGALTFRWNASELIWFWMILGAFFIFFCAGLYFCRRVDFAAWIWRRIQGLAVSFTAYRNVVVLSVAFLACIAGALLGALSGYVVAGTLGMNITYSEMLVVSLILQFVLLVPITLNGVGVVEVGYVTLFAQLGASAEQAFAFAVIARVVYLLCTLPGMLYFFAAFKSRVPPPS
jgi:hypothetical protein